MCHKKQQSLGAPSALHRWVVQIIRIWRIGRRVVHPSGIVHHLNVHSGSLCKCVACDKSNYTDDCLSTTVYSSLAFQQLSAAIWTVHYQDIGRLHHCCKGTAYGCSTPRLQNSGVEPSS